ncbi:MAG: hypothetical protein KJ583_01645 [Nanoarchaeota archaeon]|nr:hypothetical protein [Nanoarchaeota archaeon]MBU1269171.1 hypothetical protein [Nanoarchaeota archaeon]MBU1603996.1 hypothetical protein [Nanoarchaeota archaeon]MBU2443050.1 hypothetical protein [Nanoarchaeota archaeon]
MTSDDIEQFKEKYKSKLKSQLRGEDPVPISSNDYEDFKKDYLPKHMNFYEKGCNLAEKIFHIKPDKKKIPEYKEAIDICHLNITPTGAASFPILMFLIFLLIGLFFGFLIPFLVGGKPSMFVIIMAVLVGFGLIVPLGNLPFFFANNWRMKASNQMVLCIFYIVTYMRHSSNFELAVDFAAEHLAPPLSIDLKKIVWNIETGKYSTIKESMDEYLETWKKWNMEFIESMHLIESSLYESSESRRLDALDKSLTVMLDETYERMLHYAQNLKSPITTLHMMGIILPILGLVILPLVVSFMPEVKWFHLFTLYNILLPGAVFYMAKQVLSTRPTGYGETDISEINKDLKKYRDVIINIGGGLELRIKPIIISIIIIVGFLIIGFSPLIMHAMLPEFDCSIGDTSNGVTTFKCENKLNHADSTYQPKYYLLGYRPEMIEGGATGKIIGPYGLGAIILSMFIPIGLGVGIGFYNKLRSQNVIKIRDETKKLEQEFASALFQLGNRLGDGFPAEIAFSKVADVMEGTVSGDFFEKVSQNIIRRGYGVEQAIFDPDNGALKDFPSPLIESSMKVLIESSKKGPLVASNALINISTYVKEMHRVDERLKDLMSDIISSMKSQIAFLTPAISGIVIGITSMITTILGSLGEKLSELAAQAEGASTGGILSMFGTGVPTFYFQFIVSLYVIQIAFILTIMINGIENGADKLNERFLLGKNMTRTAIIYTSVAFVVVMLFNIIAATILGSVTSNLT